MVFRSRFARAKPNLSAAKKSNVIIKQQVDDSGDEKSTSSQRPSASTVTPVTVSNSVAPTSDENTTPSASLKRELTSVTNATDDQTTKTVASSAPTPETLASTICSLKQNNPSSNPDPIYQLPEKANTPAKESLSSVQVPNELPSHATTSTKQPSPVRGNIQQSSTTRASPKKSPIKTPNVQTTLPSVLPTQQVLILAEQPFQIPISLDQLPQMSFLRQLHSDIPLTEEISQNAQHQALQIPVLSEHQSRTSLPCADRSDGERDESPLFVPQPSVVLYPSQVEIVNLTPAGRPASAPIQPAQRKPPRKGRVPFHRTDLDDADSEDSDACSSVMSEATRKRRSLEEALVGTDARKTPYEPRYRPVVRRIGDETTGPMDKSSVTMRDLIYYTNRNKPPPTYRQEREMKQYGKSGCSWYNEDKEAKPESTTEPEKPEVAAEPVCETTSSVPEDLKDVKDVKNNVKEEKVKKESGGQAQFMMDADGNIVLNEESLVIRREYDEDYIDVKQDGVMGTATYASFRKQKPRSKKWSLRETIRLYKALSTVGTDFSFMARLFKYRTREEIKRKFKREEKARPTFIDRVLSNRKHFDLSILDDTSETDSSSANEGKDADNEIKGELLEGRQFPKSKAKNFRRAKRYKKVDLVGEEVPQNLKRQHASCDDKPAEPPAKFPRYDQKVDDAMEEAVDSYQRKFPPPSRPVSRAGSTGGIEDVLTRLIDQKMRDLNEKKGIRRSREVSPPPPQPTVRNRSLSLNDFCKHEANLRL